MMRLNELILPLDSLVQGAEDQIATQKIYKVQCKQTTI